jgi:dienelactone hydrolase
VTPLDSYERTSFSYSDKSRGVYRKGTGPAVVVISEIPGITPAVVGFADRVVDVGCTAVLPNLFGEAGKAPTAVYTAQTILPACVSRDFQAFATRKTSPVIDWLRALARAEHERCGGPGVGVVGMCFTGGYALAMIAGAPVLAPVLSQPSLPIAVTKNHRRDLGVSDDDLAEIKNQCAARDLAVLGLRFSHDRLVPRERFQRLHEELGDRFVAVEIDSSPNNPHGIRRMAHSVLAEDLVDEPGHPTRDALDQVLALFRTRLLSAA